VEGGKDHDVSWSSSKNQEERKKFRNCHAATGQRKGRGVEEKLLLNEGKNQKRSKKKDTTSAKLSPGETLEKNKQRRLVKSVRGKTLNFHDGRGGMSGPTKKQNNKRFRPAKKNQTRENTGKGEQYY